MNLVSKLFTIGTLLVCLQVANCLFTVKSDYNIEKFESSTKPKAAIGTRGYNGLETIKQFDESWNDLSQHINLVSDPYVAGKKPIQVYIFDSEEVKEYFGLIGTLNFCILIPCWDSKDVKVTLRYYVDGELKKEEAYTERKKLWGWAPLFIYNIFTLNPEKHDFESRNAGRILKKIAPNIAKTLTELENERSKVLAVKSETETSSWEKVNKSSLKDIIEFLRNVPDGEMKNKANDFLVNLLNKKVQTYLERQFPFVKPYLMNDLVDFDGSNFNHTFYQVFRGLILGRNPESGFKIETQLSQKDGKIIWRIDSKSETGVLYFYFSPYKKNMTLEKIISKKNGYEENLNSQETYILGKNIFDMFAEFPTYNHTDVEFLDKIN
ncbi:hypothetical protein [Leptospira santarosai]|uniref:hypothetical protein n=1 Tax=Leptospira santarosai TaxID=28183 RepID=UPI0024AF70FA|nr:hypothetical protein [Leptospira santarosai]MDI7175384.1 hypothetical protein [Leptospira santarosai]MDI7194528.1 hypothetical protein [Leptospira santarosai]MDO6399436.1 hypothetical protein [Leptospira santarosai]MDO6404370.1 hypothetical protein [Leptospira santarosai]